MTLHAIDARRHVRWLALCVYLLSMTAWAAHYTGTYADSDGTTVEITHDAQGRFTGRWHTQQGTLVLIGHAADDRGGEGVIEAGSERVPFDIALSGDGRTLTLVLRTNGARFAFQRRAHGTSVGGAQQGTVQPRTEAQSGTQATDPYVGSYRDARIGVVLNGGGGRYTGHIEANGQAYPVQLEASGQQLIGTFQVGQDRFDVRIALEGETLVVRTGTATYHLARHGVTPEASTELSTPVAGVADGLRLRPIVIVDETGFERPVTALTVMMPHDWETEGGVLWNPASSCVLAAQWYFASASTDESYRIATIARETWGSSSFSTPPVPAGCMAASIDGVRAYLVAWAQRERPNAHVLGYRDLPALAAAFGALNVDDPATGFRTWVEAGEITYAFEHRGVAVQERVEAVVITAESVQVLADGTPYGYRFSNALGYVLRAPAGELDTFGALGTMLLSLVRVDPQWQAAIDAGNRRISDTYIEGSRTIHEITMEARGFAFDLMQEGVASRSASSERADARFSEMLRETRRYFDPVANAPVELPGHFAHAWRLDDGSYKLTNDAMIVPYRDWGVDGQLIERVP